MKYIIIPLFLFFACSREEIQESIERADSQFEAECEAKIQRLYPGSKVRGGTGFYGHLRSKYYQVNKRAFICYESGYATYIEPVFSEQDGGE